GPDGKGPGGRKGPPPDGPRDQPDRGSPTENPQTRKAIAILEELVCDFPEVAEYRHLLARCHGEQRGGPNGGSERAITLLRELVRDFPRVPDYQFDLCETLSQIGRPGQSREWVVEAVKRSQDLMNQYPRLPGCAPSSAWPSRITRRCWPRAARRNWQRKCARKGCSSPSARPASRSRRSRGSISPPAIRSKFSSPPPRRLRLSLRGAAIAV